MIRLVSTSDKLQIVLGGSVATNELQVVTCYSDKTSSTYTGGSIRVNTNGTTDVDVVGAPGSSTVRDVDLINVYQRDTANVAVTLKIDVSGTETILGKWTLEPGDVLTYTHGHAWQVIDATGALKGSGSGGSGAVDSVNGQTGTVVLDPDDLDDTSTTNKFVTASDLTNLGNLSGTNSGDVSLAGTPDYITISGQTITRGQIDLAADVTGDLPLANLAQSSAASKLLGRGSASGGGDFEEISLGSGLSMSGTTLSATGGGASALDDLSDVTISTPSTNDVLSYNGTAWVNAAISVPPASLADGDYGDITVSGTGTTLTIDAGVVTFAKMQSVSANVLLGNDGTGTTVEEITCTSAGRALLDDADAAAQRTTLGLGTAAVEAASAFATAAQGSLADSATQPGDALTTLNVSTTDRLVGRDTTGGGAAEELTVGGGIEFTGSGGIQRSALTGDVTASAGSGSTTIANDAVTYAKMQNVSTTSRVLGRKTSGAGDVEECTLSEVLDFVGSAAQGDILYRGSSGWTRLGAGTSGYYLKTQGAAANPVWAAVSGGSGSVGTFPGGRLTTESGVGVSTSDRTSQSTLYYTPFVSDYIRLYNGSSVAEYAFTERSLSLSGLTSGKNYDVWLYDNSGTLTLELTAWTSDTARATALAWQTGLGWTKSGNATRLYLGTIRTTGTTTTEDSNANRFTWNAYNQFPRTLFTCPGYSNSSGASSYTHASTTWGQANSGTNNKVSWVNGLVAPALVLASGAASPPAGGSSLIGLAIDSTSNPIAETYVGDAGGFLAGCVRWEDEYAVGYHYVALMVTNSGSGTGTFYADDQRRGASQDPYLTYMGGKVLA